MEAQVSALHAMLSSAGNASRKRRNGKDSATEQTDCAVAGEDDVQGYAEALAQLQHIGKRKRKV
jgi:hypothetical protein